MTGQDQTDDRLLDLHIAEFTMLQTRNIYLTTISFTFWPAVIVYLTLIAILANLGKGESASLLAGLAAGGTELLAIGWYYCLWEAYENIRYIEIALKPEVRRLVLTDRKAKLAIWNYEPWHQGFKGKESVRLLGDWWASAILLLLAAGLFCKYLPNDPLQYFVWACTVIMAVVLALFASHLTRTRRRFDSGVSETQSKAEEGPEATNK